MKLSTQNKEQGMDKKEWRASMGKLAKRIRDMSGEDKQALFGRIGTLTAEGHQLSMFNCIFLHMQNGNDQALVQVGGFRQWQKVGRFVRKGERSIGYIYIPCGQKEKDEETGRETCTRADFFRLVPMFSVDQTDEKEVTV